MAHARRFALIGILALGLGGCATGNAFVHAGERAEQDQDYDRAVVEYTKAIKSAPDNRELPHALERAKLRAAQDHFTSGRRFESVGKLDQALVELQLAAELNPTNGDIDKLLGEVRTELRNKVAVAREGKT